MSTLRGAALLNDMSIKSHTFEFDNGWSVKYEKTKPFYRVVVLFGGVVVKEIGSNYIHVPPTAAKAKAHIRRAKHER